MKRWRCVSLGGGGTMEQDDDGKYVLYADAGAKRQMKLDDAIQVEIGLYQDSMTPSIQALVLEQEGGGYRLTGGKGCGQWSLIRKFKCSVTLRELRQAMSHRASATGASK